MCKCIILSLALNCFGLTSVIAEQRTGTPELATVADAKAWQVSHATAEALEVDGRRAIRLTAERHSWPVRELSQSGT